MKEIKRIIDGDTVDKPKRIKSVKMARRLLADYIYKLQLKKVTGEESKTMCYLLSKYVEMCKIEMELNPKANPQQNGASDFYKKFVLNINAAIKTEQKEE